MCGYFDLDENKKACVFFRHPITKLKAENRLQLPGHQWRWAVHLSSVRYIRTTVQYIGPPGTGKTALISRTAAKAFDGGDKIVIVAETHDAIKRQVAAGFQRLGWPLDSIFLIHVSGTEGMTDIERSNEGALLGPCLDVPTEHADGEVAMSDAVRLKITDCRCATSIGALGLATPARIY